MWQYFQLLMGGTPALGRICNVIAMKFYPPGTGPRRGRPAAV